MQIFAGSRTFSYITLPKNIFSPFFTAVIVSLKEEAILLAYLFLKRFLGLANFTLSSHFKY